MRQEIKDIIEGLIMRVRRSFSKEFKKEVIESIVSGQATAVELAREHSISPMTVSKWKKDYRSGKFFENTNESTTRLEIRVRELEKLVGELTMENRLLKKFRDFATKEKKEDLSIVTSRNWDKKGCKLVEICRSTYYYKSKKDKEVYLDIADRINDIALEYPYYGYRRVTAALRRQGMVVNHKKVLKMMRKMSI